LNGAPMTTAKGETPVDEREHKTAERLNDLLPLVAILMVVTLFIVMKGCILSPPPFNP
jgi:hypothetical protein